MLFPKRKRKGNKCNSLKFVTKRGFEKAKWMEHERKERQRKEKERERRREKSKEESFFFLSKLVVRKEQQENGFSLP